MSRVYVGLWSVLVVWTDEQGHEVYGTREPDAYEECERFLLRVGYGSLYEGHRVQRALIVGPHADAVLEETP